MAGPRRLLVVGSAVTDMIFRVAAFPRRAEKYEAADVDMLGGGCAGNAAVAIRRLGGKVDLLARMGDDMIGALTLAALRAEGVACERVEIAPQGRSAVSSIYLTPDGERQITAFRGAGLARDCPDLAALDPDAVLVDTRWPEAAVAALDLARARGVPGVLDGEAPVGDALARAASHVAFSAQGLRDFTALGDLDAALVAAAPRCGGFVCVTDGAAGVRYLEAGKLCRLPSPQVAVVDTLGAGDVWHGAFALGLAEQRPLTQALRFANAAAALKCTRPGGRSGAPTRSETDAMLQGFLP